MTAEVKALVLKIMILSILLNLSVGLMANAIIDNNGDKIFLGADKIATRGGLDYDEQYGVEFTRELNSSVDVSADMDDKSDQVYQLLDKIQIGWISRLKNMFNKYMYGFFNIIDKVFGDNLELETRKTVLNTFKTIMTVAYVLALLYLWKGD